MKFNQMALLSALIFNHANTVWASKNVRQLDLKNDKTLMQLIDSYKANGDYASLYKILDDINELQFSEDEFIDIQSLENELKSDGATRR